MVLGTALTAVPALSDEQPVHDAEGALRELLDRECMNLDKEKLFTLMRADLGPELAQGLSEDLRKIMEGVVKRTDFDGVPEEKTVELVRLVHDSFRRGAPLEYLDEVYDVAYAVPVTVEQLTAAAYALRDLHRSDVPRDIYEEFVYHSLENGWDPAVLPVLTRGLIYGVTRGLSPDKVALIIMLDMKNGELKGKDPDQLVLDAIKLVREKEPQKWKTQSAAERDLAAKQQQTSQLERKRLEVEDAIEDRERAFVQAQRELKELREYPADRSPEMDRAKLDRDLEQLIRKLQSEITQYQSKRTSIATELEAVRRSVERQESVKDRERQQRRERELSTTQRKVADRGRQGRLDKGRLIASVNQYLGTPYRFGGDSERGIDCSAFTRRVYRGQGIELPRNSREQARVSSSVSFNGLRAGDLVFFDTSIQGTISHVGVYLGDGVFAHASSSKGVTRSSIRERYYVKRFVKGGRIFND
jgi:cell wall-associated NlpC family hydrolase